MKHELTRDEKFEIEECQFIIRLLDYYIWFMPPFMTGLLTINYYTEGYHRPLAPVIYVLTVSWIVPVVIRVAQSRRIKSIRNGEGDK